jgi:hypothetical protein
MGCWNETCVITNTPVTAGAPAVMVLFNSKIRKEYHIFRGVRQNLIGVYHGQYDDYGCVDELLDTNEVAFPKDFDEGRHDKYSFFFAHEHAWTSVVKFVEKQIAHPDEYVGWEYKHTLKYYEQDVKVALQSVALKKALQRHKKDPSSPFKELRPQPIYAPGQKVSTKELLYVLNFLQGCRRSPWVGDHFRGCQSTSIEENRLILEIARQVLDEYDLRSVED